MSVCRYRIFADVNSHSYACAYTLEGARALLASYPLVLQVYRPIEDISAYLLSDKVCVRWLQTVGAVIELVRHILYIISDIDLFVRRRRLHVMEDTGDKASLYI